MRFSNSLKVISLYILIMIIAVIQDMIDDILNLSGSELVDYQIVSSTYQSHHRRALTHTHTTL